VPRSYSRSTAGFTLAEVLVALFVVALGLAGAASLQTLALRSAAEAARLSDGTRLAHSLAARMHANPAALALPDAANPYLELDYDAASGAPAAASPCYADATCNADELARFDTYEIADTVATQFPHGRIRVCRDGADAPGWACDAASDAPLVVKLGWRTPGDAGSVLPKLMLPLAGAAP
jgi:type IV pilus assembly protein PilV